MNEYPINKLRSAPPTELIARIQAGSSLSQILKSFGLNERHSPARKFLKQVAQQQGLDISKFARVSHKYTTASVIAAAQKSASMSATLRALGLSEVGGNSRTIANILRRSNIPLSHWRRGGNPNYTPTKQAVLDRMINGVAISRSWLRKSILRWGILDYICTLCGNIGIWKDLPISLELDHIDGNRENNNPSNLRFLCPNCHATTDTFRGKNSKQLHGSVL